MTLDEAAQQLQASSDYRVLQRVPPVETWGLLPAEGETVRACVVDCETTGLGDDAEVIELAVVPFEYEKATGRIVAVHMDQALSGFQQPSKPIPADATAVHGITDEMVMGHSISDERVAAALGDAKLLIAHNARYDRGMVAKKWSQMDHVCWGCSWEDIDWRRGGFDSGKLAYLLMCLGYFFDGHRALDDAMATLFLLTQLVGGERALFALLAKAREPVWKVTVRNSRFETKDAIKARGYRWDDHPARGKSWWKTTSDADAEVAAVAEIIGFSPETKKLPALARHSNRIAEM